jgi:L-fuconolactonase
MGYTAASPMASVDSHCHASLAWYAPVESLLHEMDRGGVERAVLIQIVTEHDNAYQQECVRRHPDRFMSVVHLDGTQAAAPRELERLAAEGATGVRLGADLRSPGEDPLAIWRTAERLGLAVSCYRTGTDPARVEEIVTALPNLKLVLEHYTARAHTPAEQELRPRVARLARFSNVFIKVTGLGEFAQRARPVRHPFPFEEPIPTNLEDAYAAFGARRMMWGSDYPPVANREGYGNALTLCQQQFASKPAADQAQIFGEVADAVFGPRR